MGRLEFRMGLEEGHEPLRRIIRLQHDNYEKQQKPYDHEREIDKGLDGKGDIPAR